MKDYVDAGKALAQQYQEVCTRIMSITERMGEEYETLYDAAYKARNMDLPNKNALKTSPVENVVVLLEKLRNDMDKRYCEEVAELERKRMDIEGIISSSGLSAVEDKVFYLRYGMRGRRLRLGEIADMVYYSERQVKRVLDRVYLKVGIVI